MKFLKDILTGIDGESYDVGRVLWALSVLIGLGLSVYSTVFKVAFDLQQYGIGAGALLAAGGAGLWAKAKTEPGEKP
jgi:hypothetical protein